jgi:DNA-binding MarR family transcriptional regulator
MRKPKISRDFPASSLKLSRKINATGETPLAFSEKRNLPAMRTSPFQGGLYSNVGLAEREKLFRSMPRQKLDFQLPLTATSPILVAGGSDHSFRRFLYDLFTVSARLETMKRYLGKRLGLTGPQYTIMMAVAELQGDTGVSVGRVGEYLHVTGTFVTIESGKLMKKGLMEKRSDLKDGRVSLLSLAPKGIKALQSLFPELQQINDVFFELDSRTEFERLCKSLETLVGNAQRALVLVNAAREDPRLIINRGGVAVSDLR